MILILTSIQSALLPTTCLQVRETFPQIWEVLCKEEENSSLESNPLIAYNVSTKQEGPVSESKTSIQKF